MKTKQHTPSRKTEPPASATIRRYSRDLVFRFKTKAQAKKKGQK
jgi:hypothetical protein